ncbi:RAF protein, partial [Aphelenchoides avenae]
IITIGLLMFSLCAISAIMIYARVRMLYLLSIMLKLKIRQIRRRKEWETCEDKLEDMVELDRGCFGVVFCAKHDGAWVAVKKLVDTHLGHQQRRFENEIWLLKTLGMRYRHPHVIRLLWVIMKPGVYIITELCHGSLHRQIHDYGRVFPAITILDFCAQIASGMKFLHSKGVIH